MSKRWTNSDLQRLADKGLQVSGVPVKKKKRKGKAKPTAPQFLEMMQWLTVLGVPFRRDYRFHDVRAFKFDIALLEQKIAFEYEGIISAKSRHTSLKGYTRDTDKYNLAQVCGWRVFRYTALNYRQFLSDIKTLKII